nr:JAB domain-containing protein [uncultured Shuttleworthia sp.]
MSPFTVFAHVDESAVAAESGNKGAIEEATEVPEEAADEGTDKSQEAAEAPIQNIMKSAILCNCDHLILLHNHPSGDISPSAQDATVTKRLLEAAKLMDMQVLDHLIVGGETGAVYSFREEHPSCFCDPKADYDYIHKILIIEILSVIG